MYNNSVQNHFFSKSFFILLSLLFAINSAASTVDEISFDDRPLEEAVTLPDWFKLSFLEIEQDIKEARDDGKKGLIIYFGQKFCPYCKAHMDNNWGRSDIVKYTQKNFDVIAIDVRGQKTVIDIGGKEYTEKQYSALKKTNFTPSILFLNNKGQEVLKLRGYRPPYQFKAALEFVADKHYQKENFKAYLARAEAAMSYGKTELNSNPLFVQPPYLLDRSRFAVSQPLMVMFERTRCHACDILHGGPISHAEINEKLSQLQVVQLDINSSTPVLTPAGKKLTADQWANELNINYTPTIIFFDENGKEIIRIESVVWFFRLRNVMDFVLTKAYKEYSTFQLWRQAKKMK